jgi:hypothetical protein
MKTEIKNAVIEGTMLGKEDHGIMTCFLQLDYGGASQSFGGWSLKTYGIQFIIRILEVLEVEEWEQLKGKVCRVEASLDKVHRIGHVIKDQWFDPEKEKSNEVSNRSAADPETSSR